MRNLFRSPDKYQSANENRTKETVKEKAGKSGEKGNHGKKSNPEKILTPKDKEEQKKAAKEKEKSAWIEKWVSYEDQAKINYTPRKSPAERKGSISLSLPVGSSEAESSAKRSENRSFSTPRSDKEHQIPKAKSSAKESDKRHSSEVSRNKRSSSTTPKDKGPHSPSAINSIASSGPPGAPSRGSSSVASVASASLEQTPERTSKKGAPAKRLFTSPSELQFRKPTAVPGKERSQAFYPRPKGSFFNPYYREILCNGLALY